MRVIGWPPRTCHERVAVSGDGVGTGEKQRQRGRLGESGCWRVLGSWWMRGGVRRDGREVGGGFGGAARKHHRHSVRHTAFSMDARTE